MRQILVTTTFVLCCSALRGQDWAGKIGCRANEAAAPANRKLVRKLWGGYRVTLHHAPGGEGDECRAEISDAAGRVVFRTAGFSVLLDETHTGQDFDGDGNPEVVFYTDTAGGAHCCWTYYVVSLAPKPRTLFEIDAGGKVDFQKDSKGRMLIRQRTAGPHGFTSSARVPFAEKVFRVQNGKLVDTTAEYCGRLFSAENEDYRWWRQTLTPDNLKRLRQTGSEAVENEEIASALLSRALQYVFCGNFDAAMGDLNRWPQAGREKMKAEFAQSIRQDYPKFAARLTRP